MAQDEEGLIGIGNKLPWRLPEELAFFKALTGNGTLKKLTKKQIEER